MHIIRWSLTLQRTKRDLLCHVVQLREQSATASRELHDFIRGIRRAEHLQQRISYGRCRYGNQEQHHHIATFSHARASTRTNRNGHVLVQVRTKLFEFVRCPAQNVRRNGYLKDLLCMQSTNNPSFHCISSEHILMGFRRMRYIVHDSSSRYGGTRDP